MAGSPDFTEVGLAFGRLSQEFSALSTAMQGWAQPPAEPPAQPPAQIPGESEIAAAVSALQSANEALTILQKSQLGHENMLEQRLTTLQSGLERLESNLPKRIAVE